MIKIRIGKDIHFDWTITTNGENLPLSGRNLKLELVYPTGKKQDIIFDTDDNIISFDFRGKDQKIIGVYGLTLWENYGFTGQTVVDVTRAFELVSITEQEMY